MSERTVKSRVTFHHSWNIRGIVGQIPSGTYGVETDEELLAGLSFSAYRRLRTTMTLPFTSGLHVGHQLAEIDPLDLATALERDAADEAHRSTGK